MQKQLIWAIEEKLKCVNAAIYYHSRFTKKQTKWGWAASKTHISKHQRFFAVLAEVEDSLKPHNIRPTNNRGDKREQ